MAEPAAAFGRFQGLERPAGVPRTLFTTGDKATEYFPKTIPETKLKSIPTNYEPATENITMAKPAAALRRSRTASG